MTANQPKKDPSERSGNINGVAHQALQDRYQKLMNFSYTKQLDEIKDNITRIEKVQSKQSSNQVVKKVMFSEDVVIDKPVSNSNFQKMIASA